MEEKNRFSIRHSKSFKEGVCKEYLSGLYTKAELERKYQIGHGRVFNWLHEFGYLAQKSVNFNIVKPSQNIPPKSESQEIETLKKELEDVKLQLEAYKLMIDIAEKELKINIRKKSNTK